MGMWLMSSGERAEWEKAQREKKAQELEGDAREKIESFKRDYSLYPKLARFQGDSAAVDYSGSGQNSIPRSPVSMSELPRLKALGSKSLLDAARDYGLTPGGQYGGTQTARDFLTFEQGMVDKGEAREKERLAQNKQERADTGFFGGMAKIAAKMDNTDPEMAAELRASIEGNDRENALKIAGAWATAMENRREGEKDRTGAKERAQIAADAARERTVLTTEGALDRTRLTNQAKKDAAVDKVERAKQERGGVLALIQEIREDPNKATGLNWKRWSEGIAGTKQNSFARKVEMLRNKIAVGERDKLKGTGQISDFEQKMMTNAATLLNTNLDAETFEKELTRLEILLEQMDAMDVGGGAGGAGNDGEDDPLGLGL